MYQLVSHIETQAMSVNAVATSASALVTRILTAPTDAVRYAEAIAQAWSSSVRSSQPKRKEHEQAPVPPLPEEGVGNVPPVMVAVPEAGSGLPMSPSDSSVKIPKVRRWCLRGTTPNIEKGTWGRY